MATTTTSGDLAETGGARSMSGVLVAVGAAAAAGLLFGILTRFAQGWLPGAWNQLANSGAIWAAVGFTASALVAGRGTMLRPVLAGLAAELALVVGYYGAGETGNLFWPLVWVGMALVAGPLFGVAAYAWRRGKNIWIRTTGVAAIAGVFGMEGLSYLWNLHYMPQAWACLAVLILVTLLLGRTHKERALSLAMAVPYAFSAYGIVVLFLDGLSG